MKKIIITSLIVVIISAFAGCGGTIQMKANYQEHETVPGAIRVYVEDFHFKDGPGGKQQLNRSVAEGNYAPWLKKALAERGAAIVSDKAQAQVVIIPQRVEFNVAMVGIDHIVTVTINGTEVSEKYNHWNRRVLLPLDELEFQKMLETVANKIAGHVISPEQTAKNH